MPGTIEDAEFRLLADNIPTPCWIANGDGYIVWYNRRWHEYTGTTPDEMEGWSWQSVHDPNWLPAVVERWRHSLDTGDVFEMEDQRNWTDASFKTYCTPLRQPFPATRPLQSRLKPSNRAARSGSGAAW